MSDIGIGLGIKFDQNSLNQLNMIVNAFKNIQNQINQVNNNLASVSQTTKKVQQVGQDWVNTVEKIKQSSGVLINSNRELNNVGMKINETYKNQDGLLTKISTQLNGNLEIVKLSVNELKNIEKIDKERTSVLTKEAQIREQNEKAIKKMEQENQRSSQKILDEQIKADKERTKVLTEEYNIRKKMEQENQGSSQKKMDEQIKADRERTKVLTEEYNIRKKIEQINQQAQQSVEKITGNFGELQKVSTKTIGNMTTITNTYKSQQGVITKITEQYDKQGNLIKTWQNSTSKVKNLFDDIAHSIGNAISKMLLWVSTGAILFSTIRGIKESFTQMSEMEVAGVNIGKVLPNRDNLPKIEESAIQLAQRYGQSVIEVEQSMASWARRYKEVNELSIMSRASLLAATATDIGFEESVTDLSAIMSEWDFKVEKSIHVVNLLNEVSNNFKVTAGNVADALAKTGSGARALGLNIEELTGVVVTGIQSLGMAGDEVGTMWTRVMARMRGNKSAREAIQGLGIDAYAPLNEILDQLMVKWDTLTAGQKQNFAITVAGSQHWSRFTAIMDNFNTVLSATAKSYFSAESAQKEVDTVMATLQKHVGQLTATWQQYIYQNNSLLNVQKGIIDGLRYIVEGLIKINPAITGTILGLTGLTAAVFVVRNAFLAWQAAQLASAVAGEIAKTSFAAFSATLLTNPVTWVVAGLAALVAILYGVGRASSTAKDSMLQTQIQMEELNQKIEDSTSIVRGIDDMSKKYDLLKQALDKTTPGTQANIGLNQKLSTVQNELAKALGLTSEQFLLQVSQDGKISTFAQKRMEELVSQINLQKQLQWQMQQMMAMQGKSPNLSFLQNFEQVKDAWRVVQNAQQGKIPWVGSDPMTSYTNQKALDKFKANNTWNEKNDFYKELEQLFNYVSLLDKNAPTPISLKDILARNPGGSGEPLPEPDKPLKDAATITEFNKAFLDMIIKAGQKFDEEVNKTISDPERRLKSRDMLISYPGQVTNYQTGIPQTQLKMLSLQTDISSESWSKFSSEANKVLDIQKDLANMSLKLQDVEEPYKNAREKAKREGNLGKFINSEQEISLKTKVQSQLESQMENLDKYIIELKTLDSVFNHSEITTNLLNEAEQKRNEILSKQKEYVTTISNRMYGGTTRDKIPERANPIFDPQKAKLIAASLNGIGDSLSNLGGIASVVSKFIDNMVINFDSTEGSFNWSKIFQGFGTEMFSQFIGQAVGQVFSGIVGLLTPVQHSSGNYVKDRKQTYANYEQLKSYRNFSGLQRQLNSAEDQYNYWKSLADIELGLNSNINQTRDHWANVIKDIKASLAGAEQIRASFGVAVDDMVSSLENAFQATNYMDFLKSWSKNLEDMTRNALVKAFLASDQMNSFYQGLSDKIWNVVTKVGGPTSLDIQDIRTYSHSMDSVIRDFYNLLNNIGLTNTNGSSNGSEENTYQAGTLVPITNNYYISFHTVAFAGNEDELHSFAYQIMNEIQDIQGRS